MRQVVAGDVAWVLVSTILVLLMTVPGLALFYAGMVRKKNVLAIMMQSFSLCAAMTIVWMVAGYSIAFTNGTGATAGLFGDLSRVLLNGIAEDWDQAFTLGAGSANPVPTTIPESVFIMFQMAFAIITPAVVTGSCADRMKFSAMLVFFTLWSLLVYAPLAHWVWSPTGWLAQLGVADFAGGTVVEINCGVTGLVCALMLGRRIGTGLGKPRAVEFELRGDRRVAALGGLDGLQFRRCDGRQRARRHGGAGDADRGGGRQRCRGVSPSGSCAANPRCWARSPARWRGWWRSRRRPGSCCRGRRWSSAWRRGRVLLGRHRLKLALRYDDSLDAFGVHGVGGIIGTLATGWFAYGPLTATAAAPDGRVCRRRRLAGDPGRSASRLPSPMSVA